LSPGPNAARPEGAEGRAGRRLAGPVHHLHGVRLRTLRSRRGGQGPGDAL